MRSLLVLVPLTVALSALTSYLVVTLLEPGPVHQPAVLEAPPGLASTDTQAADPTDLRDAIAMLETEVEALKRSQAHGQRRPVEAGTGERGDSGHFVGLASLDPVEREILRAEVTEVFAQLEEQKAAEAWEKELAERVIEAEKAFEEYDELDRGLGERVAKLGDQLGLGPADRREMRSLVALQNDRNREMSQLWSEGERSQEELTEIYIANRAKHRAEVLALVGPGGIDGYRQFLQEGGFGGRFSFFTGPGDQWHE